MASRLLGDLARRRELYALSFRRLATLARRGASPLQLSIVGRTLMHSVLVGLAAGIAGSLFFWLLEETQWFVLEKLAGYIVLRAAGETIIGVREPVPFRPWLLLFLPAAGALIGGLLATRFTPEARGGGADAIIDAFHRHDGIVRRRVPFMKALCSVFTLGFGGSGGREGPIMQIGGALGSLIGRLLRVNARERRILLVAGLAAGIAAVFRTPLGAALLAVEVLYRDEFESDALVPSVLASVVAYSVFISIFGESTLFAHAPQYPFVPSHLPLYGVMSVILCFVAATFLFLLRTTQSAFARAKLPDWIKPAIGGMLLGIITVPLLFLAAPVTGLGQGLGILGGGYGAAQLAITNTPWFAKGWLGVELLAILGVVKIIATTLTIGSGGSAGDFGPSLVVGGLFGGAFGRAAQLLLHDPRIDPGAFALVGMGTFYGGLAHCPLASLVLVCELAGSYDLLVPLMLTEGVAFIALRHKSLYSAQVDSRRDSPAHRDDLILDVLKERAIGSIVLKDRPFVSFHRGTPASQIIREIGNTQWQDIFPVLADDGRLIGIISADVLRTMINSPDLTPFTVADDMMGAPVSVKADDDLHVALEALLVHGVREIIVTDDGGKIVGFLDEAEITRTYHEATRSAKS